MHPRFDAPFRSCALATGLFGLAAALPAQVTECHLFKGPVFAQDTANVMPASPDLWNAGAFVVTTAPGDAAQITLSGGSIAGSIALVHEGGGVWSAELEFATQTAMNAMFPSSSTYTIMLSGGTLGTLTQSFAVGVEQYPNTPYLTGASFGTAIQFPAAAGATLTCNHPGPLTQASGYTICEIGDRDGNHEWSSWTNGVATSFAVPAGAITADDCHYGWLEFTNTVVSPIGALGVPCNLHHSCGTDFAVRSWSHATPECAWQRPYGDGCANLELHSSDPILGGTWQLTTTGAAPNAFVFTFFALGPLQPGLSLGTFGLNAPGCLAHIDAFSIAANVSGLALNGQFSVAVPMPSHGFGNVHFYVQTVAMTPLTPSGVGTSNAIEAFVGS